MSRLHRNLAGLSFMSAIALIPLAANAADLYRNPRRQPAMSRTRRMSTRTSGKASTRASMAAMAGAAAATPFLQLWRHSARAQPQGGFGGGQIGYNFQGGPLVFGLETDFQGGDLSGGITGTTAGGTAFSGHESVDWFGTARGRLGLAFGHALFYGTGGFAYGDVRQSAVYNGISLGASGTRTGWVAGGGIEYKVTPGLVAQGRIPVYRSRQREAHGRGKHPGYEQPRHQLPDCPSRLELPFWRIVRSPEITGPHTGYGNGASGRRSLATPRRRALLEIARCDAYVSLLRSARHVLGAE